MVLGQVALILVAHATPDLWSVVPSDPVGIVGGNEAGNCEFPTAVAILEGDTTPVMCSGTLVHPQVVTLAAHCVNPERPIVGVGFGEEGQGDPGPQRIVGVEDCVGHPQYFESGYPDIAYCVLSEPVLDVPRVPILAGCELDVLQPDVEVTIVGFGASFGQQVGGGLETEGVGPKRYTTQTIEVVDPEFDEVHMVGPDGSQSACFGDSGGPALVELADGTWRVFGAASRLYDPGGFPPPAIPGNFCGVGVTYGLLSTQLTWLEAESGYDLTPCHDDEGEWSPTTDCGEFPTAPGVGGGTWALGCGGGPLGGGEPLCDEGAGTSGTTTGEPSDESSSGDAVSGTGDGDTTSGMEASTDPSGEGSGESSASTSGGSPSPGGVTTADGPSPSSDGTSDTRSRGDDAGADEASGCGCRLSEQTTPRIWAALVLLGFGYRRRAS